MDCFALFYQVGLGIPRRRELLRDELSGAAEGGGAGLPGWHSQQRHRMCLQVLDKPSTIHICDVERQHLRGIPVSGTSLVPTRQSKPSRGS